MNQYIWNDAAILFIGRRPFHKGEIIPAKLIHENLIKQYVRYGKIITSSVVRETIKPIKLSISVMAHPSRSKYFPYLRVHCVIQDDAIVCDNFTERSEIFINEQEEKRINSKGQIQGYNFYLKKYKENLNVYDECFVDRVTRVRNYVT